jgi:hypothetical protein
MYMPEKVKTKINIPTALEKIKAYFTFENARISVSKFGSPFLKICFTRNEVGDFDSFKRILKEDIDGINS